MGESVKEPECAALETVFGLRCPLSCLRPPMPSYFDDSEKKGCWIAHTMLMLAESIELLKQTEKALRRKGLEPKHLLAAALLHDIGKLTVDYLNGKDQFHNITSAVIALNVLGDWEREERDAVAQAVLLHHEYRMWRELIELPTTPMISDYFSLIRSKKRRRITMSNKYIDALDALDALSASYLPREFGGICREIISRLKAGSDYYLSQKDEHALTSWRAAHKSLPLYYLLQLADNRAASARGGQYWRNRLKEAVEEARRSASEFSDILISKFKYKSSIYLSLLKY